MIVVLLVDQSPEFKKLGYKKVNYKLKYNENYIVKHLLQFLPRNKNLLIILNKKNNDKKFVNDILKRLNFQYTDIVEIEDVEGQLNKLYEGLRKTKINPPLNESLTVYNGDKIRLSIQWDLPESVNAIEVFEAEGEQCNFVDKIGKASIVSENKRISNLCSTGLFHFQNLKFFNDNVNQYLNKKKFQKSIAEFYDYLISKNHKIYSYLNSEDNFIPFGTPNDYEQSLVSEPIKIPFTSRHRSPSDIEFIGESLTNEKLNGNNIFGNKVLDFLDDNFRFKSFLTPSATAAMEMICDIIPFSHGSEVIIPSYTFVSSALPFTKKGWKVVFCDSREDHPNINLEHAKSLVNENTKAIVIVNYGGLFSQFDELEYFKNRGILVIEDAAQSINSFIIEANNKKRYFGSLGDLAIMSFHYTKNIGCGEGGLLIVNNQEFIEQAYIAQEKGTNRTNFLRGITDKYRWIGIGSSYLLSELCASLLMSQLINLDSITTKRVSILEYYWDNILDSKLFSKQPYFDNIYNNGHLFYLLFNDQVHRDNFQFFMKEKGVECNTHYQCLHKSPFSEKNLNDQFLKNLSNAEKFEQKLIRLPVHTNITNDQLSSIVKSINEFSK